MALRKLSLTFASSTTGKLLGFLRIQGIAVVLGATAAADALLLSMTLVSLFDVIFVSGSAILLIQAAYIRQQVRRSARTALVRYTHSMAMWLYAAVGFGLLLAATARPLSYLVAPGFSEPARDTLVHLIGVGAFIPAATALMNFISTLNRIGGREVLFTVNPMVINGTSLLALYAAYRAGMDPIGIGRLLLVGVLIATLAMAAFQATKLEPDIRRRGAQLLLRALALRSVVRHARLHARELQRVVPIISSLAAQQAIVLISYGFASQFDDGAVTVIGIAERLTNVIFTLFVATFLTILEPRWARVVATGSQTFGSLQDDLKVIITLLIPVTTVLVIAGGDLASLLFGYGSFSAAAEQPLQNAARLFGAALPGIALALIYARILVIAGLARRLALISAAAVALHIVLCAALSPVMGMLAIPVSVAATSTAQALWFRAVLIRETGLGGGDSGLRGKIAVVTALCVGATYAANLVPAPNLASLVLVSLTAAATALIAAELTGLRVFAALQRMSRAP